MEGSCTSHLVDVRAAFEGLGKSTAESLKVLNLVGSVARVHEPMEGNQVEERTAMIMVKGQRGSRGGRAKEYLLLS